MQAIENNLFNLEASENETLQNEDFKKSSELDIDKL